MFYQPAVQQGIVSTAQRLGMNPLDLATIISYETAGTFDPTKAGPTTKWGQHRGLIQFGEPQAKQHGVDWDDPVGSQLGEGGAVENYFRSSGWKPGMNILDAYSIVNAGGPGRYNASDTAAGGAPGTVRDKVEQQFGPHRAKAAALLGMNPEEMGRMNFGQTRTASSRGGNPLDLLMGGGDDFDLIELAQMYGIDPTALERTTGDRVRGGLVAAGEALTAGGAGRGADFAATDAFLEGQRQRRAQSALMGATPRPGVDLETLARQGHQDLVDLVNAGVLTAEDAGKKAAERGLNVEDPNAPTLDEDQMKMATTLRGEASKALAPYQEVSRAFNGMTAAAQQDTGAGDLSLATQFMKMLDPGSVVRESELAISLNAGGAIDSLLAKLQGQIPGMGEGQRMSPGTRQQVLDVAQQLYDFERQRAEQATSYYGDLASQQRIPTEFVFQGIGDAQVAPRLAVPPPGPTAPAPAMGLTPEQMADELFGPTPSRTDGRK